MAAPVTDDQLDEVARDVLYHYMKRAKPSKEETAQAMVATSTRSTIARRMQVISAREATAILYARELVVDPVKRSDYMRRAIPSSQFTKALTE